jgi:hypothetical protein
VEQKSLQRRRFHLITSCSGSTHNTGIDLIPAAESVFSRETERVRRRLI